MADTRNDVVHAPELDGLNLADKPDGPGAAVVLAAGVGIFLLGLLTVLSEVSTGIHDLLEDFQGSKAVGPLAGKTILATLAFFGTWAVLGSMWKNKDVDIKRSFWLGLALGILGALMTFPPIFTAFA